MLLSLLPVSLLPILTIASPTRSLSTSTNDTNSDPVVTVKNGSYIGTYNSHYNQDFFLSVPYAQPPINDLRYRIPQGLNESWSTPKLAQAYPSFCVGYGSDDTGHPVSEDCLYLEIIRPSLPSNSTALLPVAAWIHGGGLYEGGSHDARYNLSFIVANSVAQGTPIIGISIQYRLAGWGFLGGKEMLDSGNTNLGFRDQRKALEWIGENIGDFGGDSSKVTIWGESGGAQSVGAQLLAYGGRDDKLFRGAIAESGGPDVAWFPTIYQGTFNSSTYQTVYDTLVSNTSCAATLNTTSSLSCLRSLPFSDLNAALNISNPTDSGGGLGPMFPYIDNDFIQTYPSIQLSSGSFPRIPFLIGTNTDEGTAFGSGYGPNGTGVNTDQEFLNVLASTGVTPAQANEIALLYPNNQSVGIPNLETYPELYTPSNPLSAVVGLQFRRMAAYFGDRALVAQRRLVSESWAKYNVSCYTYRFNIVVTGVANYIGATHFQEVAFVFNNTNGQGYATDPFANLTNADFALAREMSGRWVGFVVDGVPDFEGAEVMWPDYKGKVENIVFDENGTWVEADTWRKEGIDWINENALSVYGR